MHRDVGPTTSGLELLSATIRPGLAGDPDRGRPWLALRAAGTSPLPASGPGFDAPDPDEAVARRMVALIELARGGDSEAFAELYSRYLDTVFRYTYYRVGSRALAEDLTSETFVRALHRIGTFTWQGRDFGAWLVTIARNLIADHLKSSRFRLEISAGDLLDADQVEDGPEDAVLERLSHAVLIDAVRLLRAQQQECVTLRFLSGLTVTETARIMGKSEGAVKTLQYRAVRSLAKLVPREAR